MNYDNIFDNPLIEPTPLSDAIHNRHSRIQELKQYGFLHLSQQVEQQPLDFGAVRSRSADPCTEKRSRKRRRRNVGFASHVMVHFSPYDFEELSSCWYTRDDLTNFKSDRKTVYKMLKSGNCDLNHIQQATKEDYRGLEPFFSSSSNRNIKLKRSQAINSVIQEQSRQHEDGIVDAEAIRQVSLSQTKWARNRAESFGKEDAQQVAPSNNHQNQNVPKTSPGSRHVHRITPLHEPAVMPPLDRGI